MPPPVKRQSGQHHGDLRNALLAAALELVGEAGPRGFTMAEAARRAGVSVAAPYKHFADRDALLAALGVRGYEEQERRFRAAISGRRSPQRQLAAAAVAYVDFAVQARPLFEVVFGAGLDKSVHPDLAAAGQRVLELLLPPAAAVAPRHAERLLISVAALAHGHAVFLLEGALGPVEQSLPDVRRQVTAGVEALLAAELPAGPLSSRPGR